MGFGKDGKGVIFRQRDLVTLLTLGPSVVVKQDNVPAITDSFRVIKSEGIAHIEGATLVDGDGPLEVWLVSDDLGLTEIAEAIAVTAGVPLSREDRVGNERAMRPVFFLGFLEFTGEVAGANNRVFTWDRTIRWTFGDSVSFAIVAINRGSGALTTGGSIRFYHTAYGVWVGA